MAAAKTKRRKKFKDYKVTLDGQEVRLVTAFTHLHLELVRLQRAAEVGAINARDALHGFSGSTLAPHPAAMVRELWKLQREHEEASTRARTLLDAMEKARQHWAGE